MILLSIDGHLGCFHFLATVTRAAVHVMLRLLWGPVSSLLLGLALGVGLQLHISPSHQNTGGFRFLCILPGTLLSVIVLIAVLVDVSRTSLWF